MQFFFKYSMFDGALSFNQDLSRWNVSKLENASFLFTNTHAFRQDISMWDTSSAVSLSGMFKSASAFDAPLNSWEVSNVVGFNSVFQRAKSFNQQLHGWDVSNGEYWSDKHNPSIGAQSSHCCSTKGRSPLPSLPTTRIVGLHNTGTSDNKT